MTVSHPELRGAAVIALIALCAATVGCRTPGARPITPAIEAETHFSARVPDVADYAAAELAAASLVGDGEGASRLLQRLRSIDSVLESGGDRPTGLVPVATDLVNASADAPRVYQNKTKALLEDDDLDPALRERLIQDQQDDPLVLANARMRDAYMISFARAFNAVAEPIGRSILTAAMAPYRLASSLFSYALRLYIAEPISLQRRQALDHWKEFVARYPNSPEARGLQPRIKDADEKLNRARRNRMIVGARRAMDANQARVALAYAERALRIVPEDSEAQYLHNEASARLRDKRENRQLSLESAADLDAPTPEARRLAIAILDPNGDVAEAAEALFDANPDGAFADEAQFARALALGEAGQETQMWTVLEQISALDVADSNMSRHARAMIWDPGSNPYTAFRTAKKQALNDTLGWLFLGPWARGLPDRGLPQSVELIVNLPSIAQAAATMPLRLIQLPWQEAQPVARLAAVYARRYLELYPDGQRAAEVRSWLIAFEKGRNNWIGVYQIAERTSEPDEEKLDELREKAAEQAFEFAGKEDRRDLRNAKYRRVAQEYPGTDAGQKAGEIASTEIRTATPQHIRISRGFLRENPRFAGPHGLGLDPSLLDDDAANGELHPLGIVLIGGRTIEFHFIGESGDEDAPSTRLYQEVSEQRFARLIAQLEETSFRNALIDKDEQLVADAHRDAFFERARLGLADEIDPRPLAGSSYAYQGMRERYGVVRARESILPFDLVVQGSLRDLSLGAFPRFREPRRTRDAILYR